MEKRFTLDFLIESKNESGAILVQKLDRIEDTRVTGRCAHALVDILLIALCATMAGAEGGMTWKGGPKRTKNGCACM